MAASSSEVRTAAGLIALATGAEGANWGSLSWRDVAALAIRERCIALAWLRSRDVIVRYADAGVAHWWRDFALRTLARGHAQVAALSGVTTALEMAGARCAVLKGAPLSVRLYGEPGARASADLDIWVPADARERARRALLDGGWRHADGALPYDEAFFRPGAHGEDYLEVHSRLLHPRLAYLPLPDPEVHRVQIAGAELPVMTGPLLPVYLAVQIARHRFAPALWLIDFRSLWERLDDEGRALAWWTARRCRAHRYLDWALRRANSVANAVSASAPAVDRLGLGPHRRDFHPMWRELRLAPLPDGALHALRAWLLPPWAALSPSPVVDVMRRVRRHWRSALGRGQDPSRRARIAGAGTREITVGGEQLLLVARDVSMLGGRMWMTATGTSMHPTLLDRDRVLLASPTRVTVGDIVLMDHGGSPVLHRVVRLSGDQVTTRGDARMTDDAPRRRGDIVARAVRVRRGSREWSLSPSPWRRLRIRVSSAGGAKVAARDSHAPA